MGPRGGTAPSSSSMRRSYGRCSGRVSALVLLKTSENSRYSSGRPQRSGGGSSETEALRAETEADIAERLSVKLSEPWSLQARAKAAAPIRETEGIGVGSEGTGSGSVVGSSGGDVGGVTGRSAGVFRKWMLCVFQSIPGL